LADQAPSLVAAAAPVPTGFIIAFIAGLVAELIGTVLLAIPFIQGRVQPRWVGYMLPTSALLAVIGNFIAPTGPATNVVINLLSNLGPGLFLVALGYLGSRMWWEYSQASRAGDASLIPLRDRIRPMWSVSTGGDGVCYDDRSDAGNRSASA
jgi:hypothetical protein